MQILAYEPTWDKAISQKDREEFEAIFHSLLVFPPFTVIRHAVNHKGELLVTSIIHNTADQELDFHAMKISYQKDGRKIAEAKFTLPSHLIPSKTSMPWTFIFPAGSWHDDQAGLGELYFG